MKRLMFVLIVFILMSYTLGDAQEKKQNPLGNALTDFGLGLSGYDPQCVRAIKEREGRGLIGPEESKYLIEKECNRRKFEQKTSPAPTVPHPTVVEDRNDCPMCGMSPVGLRGYLKVCPNGHTWR